MTDLTYGRINEWLEELLEGVDENLALDVEFLGYTDPAVVVGLMERFDVNAWKGSQNAWVAAVDASALEEEASTLPRAVALAAIRYLENAE